MMTNEQRAALRLCGVDLAAEDLERYQKAVAAVQAALRPTVEAIAGAVRRIAHDLEPWLRKYHGGREWWLRRANAAHARSLRNSPPWPGRWPFQHPSTHNRKRNRHGRKGVAA